MASALMDQLVQGLNPMFAKNSVISEAVVRELL
jgi:hypothetical protein